MALRMRRRRSPQLVDEVTRESAERASDVASEALEHVRDAKSKGRRRAPVVMVGLLVLAAAGAAVCMWWRRRREDAEAESLRSASAQPETSPAAPQGSGVTPLDASAQSAVTASGVADTVPAPAPAEVPERTTYATPAGPAEPAVHVEAVSAAPWTPAPAVAPPTTLEPHLERGQRSTLNAQREVPLFVLPPRPTVPFRSHATPAADRARLPGNGTAFLR